MDEIVKAAMAKWPHVPHCVGWLGLDARGDWYMRDAACQAAGSFPHPKGSRIEHDKLREFIARNYASDAQGQWFFQNGPQRVYVELEAAPWVWRLTRMPGSADGAVRIAAHTGADAGAVQGCWLDDAGRLFLQTPQGLGLVHSMDIELAADALEAGHWPEPQTLAFAQMPRRFAYVLSPAAANPPSPDMHP
jgi:hypothetical protein